MARKRHPFYFLQKNNGEGVRFRPKRETKKLSYNIYSSMYLTAIYTAKGSRHYAKPDDCPLHFNGIFNFYDAVPGLFKANRADG